MISLPAISVGKAMTLSPEGAVEQVVRGGENWAIVLRVDREDAESTAILVTEPRDSALRTLETLEKETENDTIGGETPGGTNLSAETITDRTKMYVVAANSCPLSAFGRLCAGRPFVPRGNMRGRSASISS